MAMLRILEPELMDTVEDAEEYDAMDFVMANTRFAEDALALVGHLAAVDSVDVGTGTARIPMLMVERRSTLSILALDLASEMLRVASNNVVMAGMSRQIKLAKMDAKALRLPNAKFDLVMCNSTVHHIPVPLDLFRELGRIAKPDGAVIIRDLIRPESFEDAWAIVKRVAAGETPKQQQLFFDSLCAALSIEEVQELVEEAGIQRMSVTRCSDRHWSAERAAVVRRSIPPRRSFE